ncbi:LVIVD repeat protein [Candidatus Magnetoovum chiemensis]|nr:LVIVD repeat protein [Candidatus Magnetoovum chiemensis]
MITYALRKTLNSSRLTINIRSLFLSLILITFCCLPQKVSALAWKGVLDTPGAAFGVYVVGDYAYVADEEGGLQVINISDPQSPKSTGSVETPDYAFDVFAVGNYAYVAAYTSGLQVIDISDPQSPQIVASSNDSEYAYGVYVSADYAYIADGDNGLKIIDISSPTEPVLAGSVDTPNKAFDVYVSGDYAYIADNDSGLQIIDVSNPAKPIIVGSLDTPGEALGVFVHGLHAFVADNNAGLQIIALSNPKDPFTVSSIDTPANALRVFVSGNYAYVTDNSRGLQIIDISDINAPAIVNSIDTLSYAHGLFVSADYAYVGCASEGLNIIEISPQETPTITASANTLDYAFGVYKTDPYVYIADRSSGLTILDISAPDVPVLKSTVDTPGLALDVVVSGNYAYVADGPQGLQIIDVSSPDAPAIVGSVITLGYARDIYVSGQYAYLADGSDGIHIIDISSPQEPFVAKTVNTSGYALAVTVSEGYAYIADGQQGLQIISISDISAASIVSQVSTPDYATGVYVDNGYAYVSASKAGLVIIDVSSPEPPYIVSAIDTLGYASRVYYKDGYAFVADEDTGIQIIDVNDAQSPSHIATVDTYHAKDVYVDGDYAYLADYRDGLKIVSLLGSVIPCDPVLNPQDAAFTKDSAEGSIELTIPNLCQWNASTDYDWITITSNDSGLGSTAVTYSISENTALETRTGTINIAGAVFTIVQEPTVCSYNLQQDSSSFSSQSSSGFIYITAPSNCQWNAESVYSWITIVSQTWYLDGTGEVFYEVSPNEATSSRTGEITIENETFTINQGGADCTYTLEPQSISYGTSSAAGIINITTQPDCLWSAQPSDNWITITTAANGYGSSTVSYTVDANTDAQRGGTIEIAGESVTIIQQGDCIFTILPNVGIFTDTGGSNTIELNASSDTCQWTAQSNASWINITSSTNQSGNATINYTVSENTSSEHRTGTITIAGITFIVTQTASSQSACTIEIMPQKITLDANNTQADIKVTASSSECTWSITTEEPWIAVNTPQSKTGAGSSNITYTIAANPYSSDRVGIIMVEDKSFILRQQGACTYDLSPIVLNIAQAGSASETITITASNSICSWNVMTNAPWITLNNTTGTGNETIQFTIAANSSSDMRIGSLIIGGQNALVIQLGNTE